MDNRILPTFKAGSRDSELAAILTDLDRCEHGRHEGDVCAGCGGPSLGNPSWRTGSIVGYGIAGEDDPIVVPERADKYNARAWRPRYA